MHDYKPTLLKEHEWRERINHHEEILLPFIESYRKWRNIGDKHPVYDFLFSYYSFSSGQLLRWSPGINLYLEDTNTGYDLWSDYLSFRESVSYIDASFFPRHRINYLNWAINYLNVTKDRPPIFHCFGLHEWAMVYKTGTRHHPKTALRLKSSSISEVIESLPVCCTHYDAFRFFSKEAVPFNRLKLDRTLVLEHDQAGCIHANMDLYKFGYKIAPFISSDLLAKLFFLAKEAREIDMSASPYSLEEFGITPIRIETKEGREEYIKKQKALANKAMPLRLELLDFYKMLLKEVSG